MPGRHHFAKRAAAFTSFLAVNFQSLEFGRQHDRIEMLLHDGVALAVCLFEAVAVEDLHRAAMDEIRLHKQRLTRWAAQ